MKLIKYSGFYAYGAASVGSILSAGLSQESKSAQEARGAEVRSFAAQPLSGGLTDKEQEIAAAVGSYTYGNGDTIYNYVHYASDNSNAARKDAALPSTPGSS